MNLPQVDPALLAEIAIGAGGLAVWFALLGVALLVTRPAEVQPAAPTQDFGGDEPPAVVSLLASRWEITEDAAESTLIDLAARRLLEFRQPANDPMQTTIHVKDGEVGGLTAYERAILDRVRGLAVNGVVPLTALTFRDQGQASSFAKRLETSIVADARARGLSQRRFSPTLVGALSAAAGVPALAIGAAVTLDMVRHDRFEHDWGGALGAVLVVWVLLAGIAGRKRGERDTPHGRAVASRWLGLRSYLRGDESFADLPPAAVAVWDRYLSYGDAVGATRVCSAVIDLGMGNRKRVWSSYGGTWHRVKVRYPHFWPRYGQKAVRLFVKAVAALAVSILVYRGAHMLPGDLVPNSVAGYVGLAASILFLSPLVYGSYTLVATIIHVAKPVEITGEVLWIEVWKQTSGGENSPPTPWLHHFAIDDGRDNHTVAWACPSQLAARASTGDIVTVTARRWTRRIVNLQIQQHGRERALEVASSSSSEDTGNIVHQALRTHGAAGVFALASALHAPEVAPTRLVTVEEVAGALGAPVAAQGQASTATGPVSMQSYRSADNDKPLLMVSVATGPTGDLVMRMRRRAQPLPGIGDEAYAGHSWAIGRRGSHVVMLHLYGDAKRIDPRNVYWLLSTAVSRLPASVSTPAPSTGSVS
jgi:Predicted membrane protein (DUF2207) C-terminal domain